MLTAVWVAVVAFVIGVGVAVYVMLKAARLMSETSAAVAGLRERGDLLIERANAAIDRAGEQIAKTEAVTASIEGVTATMSELDGHLTALAPPAARQALATGTPLTWAASLAYGIRWALGTRRAAQQGTTRQASRWPSPWPGRDAGRGATLPGRANGRSR